MDQCTTFFNGYNFNEVENKCNIEEENMYD